MIKSLIALLFIISLSVQAQATILFQDDFEGYADDPRNHEWDYANPSGTSYVELTTTEGYNSSRGLKVTYQAEGNAAYIVIPNYATGRGDVYVRFYARTSGPLSTSKFLKIFGTRSEDSYANTTLNLHSGSGALAILHGTGTGITNDVTNAIYLSGFNYDPEIVIETSSSDFVPDNTWRCYEFYMKYNTNGNRDGIYKVWIDGVLRLHATNVKNRHDSNTRAISGIELGGYTHGSSTPWYLYYDHVVLSDSYIGPLGTTINPVDGACGTNHGATLSSLTSGNANNCSAGTVADFSGTGPWFWTCTGLNGGDNSGTCSASLSSGPSGTGMRISAGASTRIGTGSTPITIQ